MNTIWSTVYYCCCLSNLDLVTYRPRGPTRLFLLVPTNNLCSIPIGFLTFREGNLPIATMLTHAYIINYMFCILIFSSYLWKLESSSALSMVEEEKINISLEWEVFNELTYCQYTPVCETGRWFWTMNLAQNPIDF